MLIILLYAACIFMPLPKKRNMKKINFRKLEFILIEKSMLSYSRTYAPAYQPRWILCSLFRGNSVGKAYEPRKVIRLSSTTIGSKYPRCCFKTSSFHSALRIIFQDILWSPHWMCGFRSSGRRMDGKFDWEKVLESIAFVFLTGIPDRRNNFYCTAFFRSSYLFYSGSLLPRNADLSSFLLDDLEPQKVFSDLEVKIMAVYDYRYMVLTYHDCWCRKRWSRSFYSATVIQKARIVSSNPCTVRWRGEVMGVGFVDGCFRGRFRSLIRSQQKLEWFSLHCSHRPAATHGLSESVLILLHSGFSPHYLFWVPWRRVPPSCSPLLSWSSERWAEIGLKF